MVAVTVSKFSRFIVRGLSDASLRSVMAEADASSQVFREACRLEFEDRQTRQPQQPSPLASSAMFTGMDWTAGPAGG